MNQICRVALALSVALSFSLSTVRSIAQDYVYATGDPNFGVNYPVPGGYINVTNGNVHLSVPLATYKQPGGLPPVSINLEYDSRIWKIFDSGGSYSWQPTNVPNSMGGWRLTTGLEQGTASSLSYPLTQNFVCAGRTEVIPIGTQFTEYRWIDSQGTSHAFDVELVKPAFANPQCGFNPAPGTGSAQGYAIDGSGYYLSVTNYSVMTVYDNRGNQVYPLIQDPNGNTITVNSSGSPVDPQGHSLVTTTTSGSTVTYQVPTVGGAIKTYTVTNTPISVSTAFNQSAVAEYSGSLTAIQKIQLPDGSAYTFNYDSGGYGELESVTLPTGGTVSLGYSNYFDSYQNENRWISTETDNGFTTSFSPQVLSQCTSSPVGCQEQMTLARAGGDRRVYTLTLNNGAWNGQTVTYQGSTPLTTVINNYDFTSYQCIETVCTGAKYIAASSSTVTLNDTNQTASTSYTYTSPQTGKLNSVKYFDYGVSSTGTPTRETDYIYNYSVNGAPLPTQKTELSGGNYFMQTNYTYDTGGRGNLITETQGASNVANSPQESTQYAYNSAGARISKTDPLGYLTSYSYTCGNVFLSQTTYPVTNGVNHITQQQPDCYTGQPATTTDENGQITRYGYDSYGRTTSIAYPDGGNTAYSYPSPSEVVETQLLSASTSKVQTTNFDGYGRKSQVSISDPAGDDLVTYSYADNGQPSCVSNAYRGSPAGQTCYTYDALDRPTEVTQPDGNKVGVAYSGSQATVTDENGHLKRYTYNAFHDLTQTLEPNANNALAWETDYTHDPGGHLLSVVQKGDGSSAARTRSFSYDQFERLSSEQTPEAGLKSYTYDANGNLKTSTLGSNTISYAYDQLNRCTSKQGSGFNNGYVYDSVSGSPTQHNAIGRLVLASNSTNADEVFSYDAMGRLNWQASWIPTDATNYGITTTATYDLAGDLASITYPDGRVVSESYDSAQHLNGVEYASWNGQAVNASYYNATGFSPAGATTAAIFGNGVQMAVGFDARQSVSAMSYATPSQTLWSKQYTWAANAKNLLQIADVINPAQTYNYTYDPDNRLTSANGGGTTLVSPATSSSGSSTVNGFEKSMPPPPCNRSQGFQCVTTPTYDTGTVTLQIGSKAYTAYYGEGSTPATVASDLASAINGDGSRQVNASISSATLGLTALATGSATDYSLSSSSTSNLFSSSPSFGATTSGSTMTGGQNAVYSGADVLAESYSPDAWGNLQQSGNFTFTQPFTSNNQVSGYSYDSAGNMTRDGIGNTYSYNGEGMMTVSNSAVYTLDALNQRVQNTGGSHPTETIYFSGKPIALLNPSTNAWTDLIWAGDSLIAEVSGTQSATPVYRLLDHEGSLVLATDNSGNVLGSNLYAPFGQVMASSTNDPYLYTGLFEDTEYGGDHALYRNYSTEQARWLRPDPYNGSYDPYNPQSFNRYSYVNGNPLGFVDPSGEAGAGVLTGIGGSLCLGAGPSTSEGNFNFCNPLISAASYGIASLFSIPTAAALGATVDNPATQFVAGDIAPIISFAVTFGCGFFSSSDTKSSFCGQSGWTSAVFSGKDQWVGTAINDSIAYVGLVDGGILAAEHVSLLSCLAGTVVNVACDVGIALAAYTALNDLFSVFWDLFGPQHFTGSLLPRPSDLGGLGTAPIGIPNQNLSLKNLANR